MSDIPRWTVSELIVRYELEPQLKDLYVEGEFDKEILGRCFSAAGLSLWRAYQISGVELPGSVLTRHNLTEGNKQRVIALARELAGLPDACSFRCLVDRDFDHWLGPLEQTSRLIWTRYASLEGYFFTDETLRDILEAAARIRVIDWSQLKSSLVVVLRHLYLLRLVDRVLGWSMTWIAADKCLTKNEDAVVLDVEDFESRLLMKNGRMKQRSEFRAKAVEWDSKISGDPRLFMRGHDLLSVLAWTIRTFNGVREFASEVALGRLLILLASNALDSLIDLIT